LTEELFQHCVFELSLRRCHELYFCKSCVLKSKTPSRFHFVSSYLLCPWRRLCFCQCGFACYRDNSDVVDEFRWFVEGAICD